MPGAPTWRTPVGIGRAPVRPITVLCTRLCAILHELEIRLHPNPLSESVA
jgi:hypothetical protein